MHANIFTTSWGGRKLILEVGALAGSTNGSVLVRYGDTVVLATAVASSKPKDTDFFPLTVHYEERLYAVGKIPGGFIKREGRPSEKAILASRLIDRPLRPLFPEDFRHEVQVITTVLSVDQDCSAEMSALLGASLALSISDIPFEGPLCGVIVGRVDGQYVLNPTVTQMEDCDLYVALAGTERGVNMVEAHAHEVSEEVILEAIAFGYEFIKEMIFFQKKIIEQFGCPKMVFLPQEPDPEFSASIELLIQERVLHSLKLFDRNERKLAKDDITALLEQHLGEEVFLENKAMLEKIIYKITRNLVRKMILQDNLRPDGRSLNETRNLSSRTGILPRAHGSGLFKRGQTQVLSVCTLGALRDVQILDGLDLEESKRFMHHYNFPPFCVGETKPLRAPGRREIGHGSLGERALEPVIPTEEDFPYTIRLVSEVLESNGSTSQASICAASLALMDGGVPIHSHVAGVAMGLIKDGDNVCILTDIQGLEDHMGDMDFKVAGTYKGITALQMDIKITSIDGEILRASLIQAKEARLEMLANMDQSINQPRPELSSYAPKILTLRIQPDKIRDVIGPSGRVIHRIIEETGVKIDIEQDGRVYIASPDKHKNEKARKIVENLVRDVEVGEIYEGSVKRIEKYGAFVEILPGKEGLVHISQLSADRVERVKDAVNVGDQIMVKVTELDEQGRINLSRKALIKPDKDATKNKKEKGERRKKTKRQD